MLVSSERHLVDLKCLRAASEICCTQVLRAIGQKYFPLQFFFYTFKCSFGLTHSKRAQVRSSSREWSKVVYHRAATCRISGNWDIVPVFLPCLAEVVNFEWKSTL